VSRPLVVRTVVGVVEIPGLVWGDRVPTPGTVCGWKEEQMSYDERTKTVRVSDDGMREIVVERWLDRQMHPPRWRSKNYSRKLSAGKLSAGDIEYHRWLRERDAGGTHPHASEAS
jgi:hypothetical protein